MCAANKKKLFKLLSPWVKFVVLIATFWFIGNRLQSTSNVTEIWATVKANFTSGNKLLLFMLSVALMLLNWSLETYKWRYLIQKIEKLPFRTALSGVLTGVAVGLFTPNRIGEYAGRVVCIEKADRMQAALITVIGSLSQLLITLLVGALGFLAYLFVYQHAHFGKMELYITVQFYIVLSGLLLLLFLNSSVITILLSRIRFLKERYSKYIDVFSFYSTKELAYALWISFIRYGVFSLQYYLMLRFFDVDMSLLDAAVLVPVYFLALTAIPTITLAELGVREVVALNVFSLVSTNEFGMVATSFFIWCINLAIPASVGAVLMLRAKIFKSSKA